jgi:hypothetical protein
MIPEIAIIGHPNEGKSSVLSTLAEDDSVIVSEVPGETTQCRTFPVVIDGREILRFTDTPGFQSPSRLLAELERHNGSSAERLQHLFTFTSSLPDLQHDQQLLQPLLRGASIIYVVDGSRPIRNVDKAEMEILRLIGRPRMAVINPKQADDQFLAAWKDELAKHFNSCRIFNAHQATYRERIDLLEALKSIDQDWQKLLDEVIGAVKKDWAARTRSCATIICSLLSDSLSLQLREELSEKRPESELQERLVARYTSTVAGYEREAHQKMRSLFKHNLFNCTLPEHSILREDLFSKKSWQLLGLTTSQFLMLGGISGLAVGAGVDVAALGHGLGLFTAIGGVAGTVGALLGRKQLGLETSLLGVRVAGSLLQIGPAGTISLLFVIVNRAFLFFEHISNWAHGRRDHAHNTLTLEPSDSPSFTHNWPPQYLKTCNTFFKSLKKDESGKQQSTEREMEDIIFSGLMKISRDKYESPGKEPVARNYSRTSDRKKQGRGNEAPPERL